MTSPEDIAHLQSQLKDIYEDLWKHPEADFYEDRKWLQRVVDRKEPVKIDPRWAEYARGINIQSPMLKTDVGVHVDILSLDTVRIDFVPREVSRDAKKDIEDARTWAAQSLDRQNPGNRLGKQINLGQVVRGVGVVRKIAKRMPEPDAEYYRGKGVEDGDPKAREEFFQNQNQHCFQSYYVDPLEMCWNAPWDDPTIVFQQTEITHTQAKNLRDMEGREFRYDGREMRVHFVSRDPVEGSQVYAAPMGQKFNLVIREELEEDGNWWCTEWVKATGADWEKGEMFNRYKIPFNRSSYFIIPSGDSDMTAKLPGRAFVPKIQAEAVLVYERNYINVLMVSLARMQLNDRFFYLNITGAKEEHLKALQGEDFEGEGGGATKPLLLRTTPTDNPDELAALPGKVEAWPFPISEHLTFRIQELNVELERERPNRLMIGQATGKSDEPTATGLLDQRQAAAMPYEGYLKIEDNFWEEFIRAELQAILTWEDGEEDEKLQKSYYYRANGKEPVRGRAPSPGTEIVLTPKKIRRRYDVIARTRNKTMAEKMQSDLAAYQHRMQGTLTEEQLIEQLDWDNPQQQLEELARERYRKMAEEELGPIERIQVKILASVLYDAPLQDYPLPQYSLQNGKPNMPTGPEPNTPAGNQLPLAGQVGPAVTPAPVAGPGDLRGPAGPAGI